MSLVQASKGEYILYKFDSKRNNTNIAKARPEWRSKVDFKSLTSHDPIDMNFSDQSISMNIKATTLNPALSKEQAREKMRKSLLEHEGLLTLEKDSEP